jgi:predicted DNA binding CopG/RHH family protein
MYIYRYILHNHLIYIHYDPNDEDIIKKISSYEILSDDTISEIKQSYDVETMPYSLYINSLVTLAKLELL